MMSHVNTSTYGIFPDQSSISEAVNALKAVGFRTTDISILFPDNVGTKDFGHQKSSKAPEGAVAGGSAGAILGSMFGWFAGIGTLAIPGLEPFAVAGPIMGMLSGLGLGMLFGGVTGAIAGATVPEYEAKRFVGRIRRGGILISVHCDNSDWTKTAIKTLKRSGALDIGTSSEAKADFAVSEKPMPRSHAVSSTFL
jgi:hypothetical protein